MSGPRYEVAKTPTGEDHEVIVSVIESREWGILRDNPPQAFMKVYRLVTPEKE